LAQGYVAQGYVAQAAQYATALADVYNRIVLEGADMGFGQW
jgi:hypothetical protein